MILYDQAISIAQQFANNVKDLLKDKLRCILLFTRKM